MAYFFGPPCTEPTPSGHRRNASENSASVLHYEYVFRLSTLPCFLRIPHAAASSRADFFSMYIGAVRTVGMCVSAGGRRRDEIELDGIALSLQNLMRNALS